MPSTPLRLVTWNCCRLRSAHRIPGIENLSPDILILQEAPDPDAPAWCEVSPNLGVAVYGGNEVQIEPLIQLPHEAALLVRARGRHFSTPVLAIWAQRAPTYADAVLRSLTTAMEALPGEDLIVTGDLNLTPVVANRRDMGAGLVPSPTGPTSFAGIWRDRFTSITVSFRSRGRS
jgi:hypothetical protein